jgi:hypothetical protein
VGKFCITFDIVNLGSCHGNTAQALAQWWHPVASSEAMDVLHWAMCPALHRRILMAIKIASDFPAFFASLILLSPITVAKNHVMVIIM